jgi:hypothetical protein
VCLMLNVSTLVCACMNEESNCFTQPKSPMIIIMSKYK